MRRVLALLARRAVGGCGGGDDESDSGDRPGPTATTRVAVLEQSDGADGERRTGSTRAPSTATRRPAS